MIAGLPMYDRPETAAANDRFWELLRTALADRKIDSPKSLTRNIDPWALWTSPDLVLAQTCGLPYRAELHDKVNLIGTPVYDLPCERGYYFSVIVARKDDPRTQATDFNAARLAYNEPLSQSGWAAAQGWAAQNGIRFDNTVATGAHLKSAQAVVDGFADCAAIDALTWSMIQLWDGFALSLKEIARTDPTPTLPYIAAKNVDPDAMYHAIHDAIAALFPQDKETLGLRSFVRIPHEQYLAEPIPMTPQQ